MLGLDADLDIVVEQADLDGQHADLDVGAMASVLELAGDDVLGDSLHSCTPIFLCTPSLAIFIYIVKNECPAR